MLRSPDDVLAAVPVLLGFVPRESVVLLTFGGTDAFHARIDLPAGPEEVEPTVELLLEPARRHRVERAIPVLYTDDEALARTTSDALGEALEAAGVDVPDRLRCAGGRWFRLLPGSTVPAEGVALDPAVHPFAAQAVLDGRVTHSSREELAATLDPLPRRPVRGLTALTVPLAPAGVEQAVRSALDDGRFSDLDLASVLVSLDDPAARDAAWGWVSRDEARDHVRLWGDAVRRAPDDLVAGPAAVLGLVAWLAGDGALAWCAVDRCLAVQPRHSLALLVADLLGHAVPPSTWSPMPP
ncbi:DUF4192 domain-containing protein [Nocardioides sp. SYSU D00038]|uniref:DUF4192 domain-containing protein n=1 Tax=Nocardioides sp. SYSU D00038 TaxID=2812554 RepID=UPI001968230B|nr:DUF4192 domain-containing protein [Nocardioides sp. SYSU D00038]